MSSICFHVLYQRILLERLGAAPKVIFASVKAFPL
jgi:hypothetical protein